LKKNRRYMGNRGFTLVELLVALAVGSIILLAMGGVYVFTTRAAIDNNSQAYLQRQAALIIEEMARQIRPATQLAIATCSGVANSLQVTEADGTVYCYRRDSAASGTGLIKNTTLPGQPTDSWDLLSGAPVTLTTVNGPTVDGAGNCGTTAGFCPGLTGSAPVISNGGKSATVTFRLRYRFPETQQFQQMTFTTDISRRN